MKIGILTLPLHTNYGGILQAYALQSVLNSLGHDAVLINLPVVRANKRIRMTEFFKRLVKKFLLFKNIPLNAWPTAKEAEIMAKHIIPFVQQHLHVIECPDKKYLLDVTVKEKLKGYVVGSDQVWRPAYSATVSSFFLDFLPGTEYLKISYAASFGIDVWPFTEEDSIKFGNLLKAFKAVSVREDSAATLCKTHWNIDAKLVLDPTLLLDKRDYMKLYDLKPNEDNQTIMVYILDKNSFKTNVVKEISSLIGLPVNEVGAKDKYWNVGSKGIEKCIVPPISEWIAGFMNAGFVVTDSFHGMVFSILFEKSFICIGNKTRGISRFTSLLKLFRLEDRLIYSSDDFSRDIINKPIDYRQVDIIRQQEKLKSVSFLSDAFSIHLNKSFHK